MRTMAEPMTVIYRLQCAVITNGCRSAIAIDGPRNIDVYDLDRQVPEDRRVADLLAASGWWLDHGQWVCGNHDTRGRSASGHPFAGISDAKLA
jgi:hypothetical protein